MIGEAFRARGAHALAAFLLLGCATPALAQQQIFSGVESDPEGIGTPDKVVSGTAGAQVSTNQGGGSSRAQTDFGVNKVYGSTAASATANYIASSAWLDTFTAGGAAGETTRVTFQFTMDGIAGFTPTTDIAYNYKVMALRGGGWSIGSIDGSSASEYGAAQFGDQTESLMLQQVVAPRANPVPGANPPVLPGRVVQYDMRDPDGFWNYAEASGEAGLAQSHVEYDAATDTYTRTIYAPPFMPGWPPRVTSIEKLGPDGAQRSTDGGATYQYVAYSSAPNSTGLAMANARTSLVNSYSMLDHAQLCDEDLGTCTARTWDPTVLELSFEIAAGSTFTIASWLFFDDLEDGTIDFFNTAKVTGIKVDNPTVTLTSEGLGKAFVSDGNGNYGYPAALAAAVPEPGTWAMMIGGLGLIGGGMRTRRRSAALA